MLLKLTLLSSLLFSGFFASAQQTTPVFLKMKGIYTAVRTDGEINPEVFLEFHENGSVSFYDQFKAPQPILTGKYVCNVRRCSLTWTGDDRPDVFLVDRNAGMLTAETNPAVRYQGKSF